MSIWTNRNWKPMLLKEIDAPFNSKDYLFELKYDGIRATCFVNKKSIYFQSRNNTDLTFLFPELNDIKQIVNKNVIFDGEIVAFDENKLSFSKIQERLHVKNKDKIRKLSESNPVIFVVFDILYEGKDLTNKSLLERKDFLNKYVDTNYFMKTKYIMNNGIKLFESIKKLDLEGIVAKNKNSLYHVNKRTNDFIKIKNIKRDEFLVAAYKETKEKVTIYLCDKEFNYAGKCSISIKSSLYKNIKKKRISKPYINVNDKDIKYIKPDIEVYIEYTEKTKNGHLRHPAYKEIKNEK